MNENEIHAMQASYMSDSTRWVPVGQKGVSIPEGTLALLTKDGETILGEACIACGFVNKRHDVINGVTHWTTMPPAPPPPGPKLVPLPPKGVMIDCEGNEWRIQPDESMLGNTGKGTTNRFEVVSREFRDVAAAMKGAPGA